MIGDTVVGFAHIGRGERVMIGPTPGARFASLEPEVLVDLIDGVVEPRRLTRGIQTFVIRGAERPARVPLARHGGVDARFAAYLVASAIAALLLAALAVSPARRDRLRASDRAGMLERPRADREPVAVAVRLSPPPPPACSADAGGARPARRGKPEAPRTPGPPTQPTPPAARTGILPILDDAPGDRSTSLAREVASLGFDDGELPGGLLPNDVGEVQGGWGYGQGGIDEATGWGAIGVGRYGTIGLGAGTGQGCIPCASGRGRTRRGPRPPSVTVASAPATLQGFVSRRRGHRLRCHAGAGEVIARFVISPRGKVQGVVASGVDAAVSRCVAGVLGAVAYPGSGDHISAEVRIVFRDGG